jgi:hypothetical protein
MSARNLCVGGWAGARRARRVHRCVSLWLVLPGVFFLWPAAGCEAPAPRPDREKRVQELNIADLEARPLYTFTEAEVDRYLRAVRHLEPDLPRRVVHLGRKNIGQPYEIFLLGEFPFEFHDPDPIYCLSRSDCLTFCEHTYALALSGDWWTYLRTLQRLRYRDGVIGVLTRNHYTEADWNRNNAWLFEDITTRLGGGRYCVPMREVIRRAQFFARYGLGQGMPDERFTDYYIPRENVLMILGELRDADFVNIVRGDDRAQFVGHTGLIALDDNGVVNLLHSASPAVQELPLVKYLDRDRRCLGIKVLRLRPQAERIVSAVLAASTQATPVNEAALRAALAANPVMSTGAPPAYSQDWARAMRLQSYRLGFDTPVDPDLQGALEAIDAHVAARYGIPDDQRAFGVLDLRDLRLALVRPDAMFYGASVPKICIVQAYFETHPEAVACLAPDVERELQLVIKRSDNALAAKYSQLVGLETIQKMLTSDRYRFYDAEHGGGLWCGKHYGIDQPRIGDPRHDFSHGATVRQCLRYYLMLEQGKLVSAAASARIKQIFAAPALEFRDDKFVRGLNGRDVTILRKSGLWEDWHLDTARVQHGDRVYLLAGMAHHPKGSEYLTDMAAAVDEALCGVEPPRPFVHRLLLHQQPADFVGGQSFVTEENAGNGGPAPNTEVEVDETGLALRCPPHAGIIYESPVIDPGLKFNEVVASWNVDTPPDTGFCVEVRVGRDAEDLWSPYLYLGDWGTVAVPGERVVDWELGRVDVDYFRSDERFDRVQYRIRAVNAAPESRVLRVRRLGLCVSDMTGIPESVWTPRPLPDRPPAEAWQRRLPVPFRSQKTDRPEMKHKICSPTSVAMVLAYRGIERTSEEVADAAFDPTHGIYGNWPRNVQAAYSLGQRGYLARFSDWTAVERMIAAGQPLVISIRVYEGDTLRNAPYRSSDGHLIVLAGFDEEGRVLVNDPAVAKAERGQLAYYREDLEKVWMRATGGLAYVFD